ncbi:hypothetical protein D3C72_2454830 [compost metagenome]
MAPLQLSDSSEMLTPLPLSVKVLPTASGESLMSSVAELFGVRSSRSLVSPLLSVPVRTSTPLTACGKREMSLSKPSGWRNST